MSWRSIPMKRCLHYMYIWWWLICVAFCVRLLVLITCNFTISARFFRYSHTASTIVTITCNHSTVTQLLCRVRGYKYVIKLFPHDVCHFETCMKLLHLQDKSDYQNWETRYILMLWLCILCIIPFDICSMDSSLTSHSTTDGKVITSDISTSDAKQDNTLVNHIITICLSYLSDPGPTRDAASACLSTLLTRPDMESHMLHKFIQSAIDILNAWGNKADDSINDLTSS